MQNGKVTAIAVVASGVSSAVLKWRDTSAYQVASHGDYVQETH